MSEPYYSQRARSVCVSLSAFFIYSAFHCFSSIFRRDASICIVRISYGNVAGWVAVCHSRYCIKMTKPVSKLFRPSGSPS